MNFKNNCLLVIDVQVGAFDGNKIPALVNGKEILGNIKQLIEKYRSESGLVVYVQDCGDIGEAFEQGTESWKIHPEIFPLATDQVILKSTPSAFDVQELPISLKKHNINQLEIVGLHSQYCYTNTVLSAIGLGFDVTVVSDGHGAIRQY